jgi:hypothetical protein
VVSLLLGLIWTGGPSLAGNTCRPGSRDSDRDHIPDCWEPRNGLVVGRKDQATDHDRDGLTALREFRLDAVSGGIFTPYRANDANSDDDGGWDKGEWIEPTLDGWEDLDGDGFGNLAEYVWRSDPADPDSYPELPALGCVVVPPSIKSDGSVNVTQQLQAVLDEVPDGGCLELGADARYKHNGTLKIAWRNDLTVNGNGATLFTNRPGRVPPGAANSLRPHVRIIGGQNVTLDGITIDGPNARRGNYVGIYEGEHGFDVKGGTGHSIRNSTVRQVYGDFVYVDDTGNPPGSGVLLPTTGLIVSNNTFRTAGRHGLAVGGFASDVRFEGNLVSRVARSAVNFEMLPGRVVSEFEIVGNTFRSFGLNWIAAGAGVARDIYFGSNQIEGDSMHTKTGPRTLGLIHERWTFEGNVSDSPHHGDRVVFYMFRMHDVTFVGNVQPMYPGGAGRVIGIYSDVCGVTAVGNTFTDYQELFYPTDPPPC